MIKFPAEPLPDDDEFVTSLIDWSAIIEINRFCNRIMGDDSVDVEILQQDDLDANSWYGATDNFFEED